MLVRHVMLGSLSPEMQFFFFLRPRMYLCSHNFGKLDLGFCRFQVLYYIGVFGWSAPIQWPRTAADTFIGAAVLVTAVHLKSPRWRVQQHNSTDLA
jgi:hypothetical protein